MRTTGAHNDQATSAARAALSTVVHASGCAPLLLFILLDRLDAYLPGQLDRNPADLAI
jgi:hypothetical protein